LLLGPVDVATIGEWEPSQGKLVSWRPTPATSAKVREAPVSVVPPSYIQARHLRNFSDQAARGRDHSRLFIATCEILGQCDIRAMTYVINAHLRRHNTYRNWFECQDSEHIVRHTIGDPTDIEFAPTELGVITIEDLRAEILATPDPLQWDCFRFGIIQSADRFTFYASIDHLHVDGQFIGVGLVEFQTMYAALVIGGRPTPLPEAGSYDDYAVRQREYTSSLTRDSREVRAWKEFAERNNGSFPEFPLPLGDLSVPCSGDMLTVTLMDPQQTQRFESACVAAGARFIGGMFACVGLAVHALTGADTYFGLTPKDTRRIPEELTTQGWFTGLIPVTVPIAASFNDAALAAQTSFDSGTDLAEVPFERVVELVPSMSRPQPFFSMLNFFDPSLSGAFPLLANFLEQYHVSNLAIYTDGRVTYPVTTLVGRFDETVATVLFPKNPVARESVTQYLEAIECVCVRVADGGTPSRMRNAAELSKQPGY